MTRIAILGATSQIARDLTAHLLADPETELALFARRPEALTAPGGDPEAHGRISIDGFDRFGQHRHDVIINCVGVGDPARAKEMGAAIFEVTQHFDQMALDYTHRHPDCRYLFLSSGAVYGPSFAAPVDEATPARIPINALAPSDYYGVAKLAAECRHRTLPDQAIVDLRVFSYFSRTQDLAARFYITDIVRAIRAGEILTTAMTPLVRDYIHPRDLHALVRCLLRAPRANLAVDCYSLATVDRMTLLTTMADRFGLMYQPDASFQPVDATGSKANYYSLDRRAAQFGYTPTLTSIAGIVEETEAILGERPKK